ncbi:MAG: LysR substrate-binding domain-containing protein [Pseudomonadota bacterium]
MTQSEPKRVINFKQLRCFHAVATEGSFTKAAKALGLGQPSITTHVKALEDYYGVELFSRHGQHVEPTDLGAALLEIAHRTFSLERDAVELLSAASGFRVGHLRIGAIGPSQVTEMILAFGQIYPDVELSVAFGNSEEIMNRVLDFRADVGVLPSLENDSRFHSMLYSRNRIVVLVPIHHPWAKQDTVTLPELEGQRLVLREVGSATRRTFEEALAKANVSIKRVLAIGSREALRDAVAHDLGIGIALDDESLSDSRVKALQISDTVIELQPHLVCLRERINAPLIKAFFKEVQELTKDR